MVASRYDRTDIVKQLIINSRNLLDVQSKDGWNAIMVASKYGRTDIVSLLIQANVALDVQAQDGWTALLLSSWYGHADTVKCLIGANASLDVLDKTGCNALMLASGNGHVQIVKYLLASRPSLDIQEKFGETALMLASRYGYVEITKQLIEAKASLDIQSEYGETALMIASENGYLETVTCLIEANASLDVKRMDEWTGLMLASRNGHVDIVKRLIQAQVSLNAQNMDGETALIVASQNGHAEVVECLIEAKASLDIPKKDGKRAIILAFEYGYKNIVQCLIKANASLYFPSEFGDIALLMASWRGNTYMVQLLINQRIPPDVHTKEGETAVIFASENGHTEIVKLLVQARAPLDMQRKDGKTAALLAFENGHMEIVKCLINANASLDLQSEDGITVIVLASKQGRTDIVKCLIEANVSLDVQTKNEETALILASENGYVEIIKLLVEAKASLNIQREIKSICTKIGTSPFQLQDVSWMRYETDGHTALMLALRNGHLDIAKHLIDANASLDIQRKDDETALILASEHGYDEIVELLVGAKASLDIQRKNGRTALHELCYQSPPNVRLIVFVIEAGANLEISDKEDKKPLDPLPSNSSEERYRPIKKALQRREYSQLLASGKKPMNVVKMFLLGHPKAGKTTLKSALIKKPVDPYAPTPGIDVGTYKVENVGDVCIWDTAGHIEFHITHSLFLGLNNAMAVVAYDLTGGRTQVDTKLKYWIKFLTSGLSASQKARHIKFKVILVGTHKDQIEDAKRGEAVWKRILLEIENEFAEVLDIEIKYITVNGCDANSADMKYFRECIGSMAKEIKGTRTIPRICKKILKQREQWIGSLRNLETSGNASVAEASNFFVHAPKRVLSQIKGFVGRTTQDSSAKDFKQPCPVIPYKDFENKVRDIDPLASSDIIRIAGNYLEDMGEIFIACFKDEEPLVVLNTQWLCFKIIGQTFAGEGFDDQLKRLPDKPFYNVEELEEQYSHVADFPKLETLLKCLDLMVKYAHNEMIIIAKLQSDSTLPLQRKKHMFGVCVFCEDQRTMFTPALYPAIQARIMKRIKFEEGRQPLITQKALAFVKKEEGLIELSNNKEIIRYVVGTDDDHLEKCQQDLDNVSAIIETALLEVSRGTSIKKGYLSQCELLKPGILLDDVSYYTQEEIETAGSGDGILYRRSTKERVSNILVQGHDGMFIRKLGIQCDIKWLLCNHKREFLNCMDKEDNPMRRDSRSLADFLGISECVIQRCKQHKESVTEGIVEEWRQRTGKKVTFQMMLTWLHHPGLVGNVPAAKCIERCLVDCGHKGPYPLCNIKQDMTDGSDTDQRELSYVDVQINPSVVLWRAVLRKAYGFLVKRIRPSKLIGLSQILSPQDMEEITVIEIRDGLCVKAVDVLIEKLMSLQDPAWPGVFVASMQTEYAPLADELAKMHQCLENDISAHAVIRIDTLTSASRDVPDVENYVKVCMAIQSLCFTGFPTVQESMENWHQKMKQQMAPCQGTANCVAQRKPTAKSGACQPCIDWAKVLEAVCYPTAAGIQWRNINAALFHHDPIEVAKGFIFKIPPGQNYTTFGDFDIGGILKLMMGFKFYHNGDRACYDKIQEVLDIRNKLSHMKVNDNMVLSDRQLRRSFDVIENLVKTLVTHQPNLDVTRIKARLKKIKQTETGKHSRTTALGPLPESLKQALDEGMKKSETRIVDALSAIYDPKLKQLEKEVTDIKNILAKS